MAIIAFCDLFVSLCRDGFCQFWVIRYMNSTENTLNKSKGLRQSSCMTDTAFFFYLALRCFPAKVPQDYRRIEVGNTDISMPISEMIPITIGV